jgi:CRP/FNR family transcriptional regulator, nitrogen oxide reductase regulator
MPPQPTADFLKAGTVFAALPAAEILSLAAVAREQSYRPRDFIFREGDESAWFWLVRTGRVKILRQSRSGDEVVLELLGPGEPFGGVAVLEGRPYPASAQAMETSTVVGIPRAPIVALAERHPTLAREMALMLGRRLRTAHDSVRSLASDPVEARLASRLIQLAEREGTRDPRGLALPFHLTRQTLADMCGTTVESTIRVMSRWIRKGVVIDEDGRLIVASLDALRGIEETGSL